jgi:hypothetical protein
MFSRSTMDREPMTDEHQSSKARFMSRWYDRLYNFKTLLRLCRELGRQTQDSIGNHVIDIIRDENGAVIDDHKIKNLGTETVLSLYKSKRKQRWYDLLPSFHRAVNQLLYLPEPVTQRVNRRCEPITEYIYLIRNEIDFGPYEIHQAIQHFVRKGPKIQIDSYLNEFKIKHFHEDPSENP